MIMKLSEKLRNLRKTKKLTQPEVAEILGITSRAYKSYELDQSKPRYRNIYEKLANLYDVDINYLLIDDDKSSKFVIDSCRQLFAGGELSPEDKKAVFLALKQAYEDSLKDTNKE